MERAGLERDDQKLVTRIRERDTGALWILFHHYYPRVHHFALRRVRRPARAESLASDVFLEAWRSVEAFRGGSAVASWLYGIAHFKCTGAPDVSGRTTTKAQKGAQGEMAGKCPEGVLTLIPWYRELDADDRGIVEAHAAGCAACRSEIEMVSGGAVPPTPFPDRDASFSRLMARIEHAERRGRDAPAHAKGWRVATLAAAAMLLTALGVAASHLSWPPTGRGGAVSSGPAYTALQVVFRDGVSAAQIEHALASVDAVLVAGPNAMGSYLIAVAPGADPRRVAGLLLAGSREHPEGIASSVAPKAP